VEWNRQAMVKVPDQKFVEGWNCLKQKNCRTAEPFEDLWTFAFVWLAGRGRDLMARAERYRLYAAECVRLARKSDSVAEKYVLLQMAEHWRRLAQCAEKDERKRPHSIAS
jgi:hypothetical protein